jgi:glutathione S-transferase
VSAGRSGTDASASKYRLYSENGSPFSAPVRVAIYAKDLDFEIVRPPGGLKSAAYHALNPTGTIPCLVRDDGFLLPESAAILEFLEDMFPARPLLPPEPELRGRVRLLQRIGELGVTVQTVDLARLAQAPKRDDQAIGDRLTKLVRALASLDAFMEGPDFAVGRTFTLADCQLGPSLFNVPIVSAQLGLGNLLAAYPKAAAYHQAVLSVPPVRRVLLEMQSASQDEVP